MKIEVKYPSGMAFEVVARWEGYMMRQGIIRMVVLKPFRDPEGTFHRRDKAIICDPRGVYKSGDVILYHPRENDLDLPSATRKWLEEYPAWGGPADGVAYSYRVVG